MAETIYTFTQCTEFSLLFYCFFYNFINYNDNFLCLLDTYLDRQFYQFTKVD